MINPSKSVQKTNKKSKLATTPAVAATSFQPPLSFDIHWVDDSGAGRHIGSVKELA
jgi:hypothetical protein